MDPNDIVAAQNVRTKFRKVVNEIFMRLVKTRMIDPGEPETPYIIVLREICRMEEPERTALLNEMKSFTFPVAVSKPMAIIWDRRRYILGPVLSSVSFAVAIRTVMQLQARNRTFVIQETRAQMLNQATNATPVMMSWRTFDGADGQSVTHNDVPHDEIISGQIYKHLLDEFRASLQTTARYQSMDSTDLFRPDPIVRADVVGNHAPEGTPYAALNSSVIKPQVGGQTQMTVERPSDPTLMQPDRRLVNASVTPPAPVPAAPVPAAPVPAAPVPAAPVPAAQDVVPPLPPVVQAQVDPSGVVPPPPPPPPPPTPSPAAPAQVQEVVAVAVGGSREVSVPTGVGASRTVPPWEK